MFRLTEAWYQGSRWLNLLRPLALLYQAIAAWRRNNLTRSKRWRSPVPVIVVGNISIGGTGKTPAVICLVEYFKELGFKPGIVSRGYGGKANSYPVLLDAQSKAVEVGDEPLMMHLRCRCPVVVDPDRVAAARHLLEYTDADLIIADDGLQHYALARDIEIAVIDGSRGLGNGLCLPAGPLREPATRLEEVDFILINGGDFETSLPFERMVLRPDALVNLVTGERRSLNSLQESNNIHAVAGIGNPGRFFDMLVELGYEPIKHPFEDHYRYTYSDLAFGNGITVIMTEKDAVKCAEFANENMWYVAVAADLPDKLLAALGERVAELTTGRAVL